MQNYKCKNCGAELYWSPSDGCLKCGYCDYVFNANDFKDQTISGDVGDPETVESQYVLSDNVTEDMVVYKCNTCGGEVVALKTTMATICPYCGEAISITSKSVGNFRPSLCIPFAKEKNEAIEICTKYMKSSFLTPKSFKDEAVIEKIQGMYVPFYLHDLKDDSTIVLEGEKKSDRRCGDDKVTKHDVYALRIEASGSFKRVPTDASQKIEDNLMDAVEPFDYKQLASYNPAYMAGYVAEQYDDDENSMRERASDKVKKAMKDKAQESFKNYDSVVVRNESHKIHEHEKVYAMLPVWFLNVAHAGKKYKFAINGQTGKITGKLPISFKKLGLFASLFFVFAEIALIFII